MKKFITPILFSVLFIGISISVLSFFPNEMAFKIINEKGIESFSKGDFPSAKRYFEQGKEKFTHWNLVSKNNTLGILYAEKKYKKLEEELKKITKKECSFNQKSIPEFCENIFYLDGITQYRLGENFEKEKQKNIFKNAILDFQKALALNPKNIWAKENIDFILKKLQKKKENQSSTKNSKSKKNSKKDKEANQENKYDKNSSKQSDMAKNPQENKNGGTADENNKKLSDSEENFQGEKNKKTEKNSEQSDSENSKNGKAQNESKKSETSSQASRLPKEIQDAIKQTQQNLEDQSENQTGFNRSLSAAQNNKNNTDPFDTFQNDPFFQQFFGNDPFFNRSFEKKFNKTISNPNEKDW